MKNLFILLLSGLIALTPLTGMADSIEDTSNTGTTAEMVDTSHAQMDTHHTDTHADTHHAEHKEPAPWSVIPFVILLLMIATGPLFYSHFWHKNYPLAAIGLGLVVVIYYLAALGDQHHPVHHLSEYISFICLIAALFISAAGILIKVDREGTPIVNVVLLIFGAAIANIIGTTGASMLLIFPFIRLNRHRIKAYHVVFFIFMVSNVGGCLTPIGDPPLFLGFLKGVDFFWTVEHVWPAWIFGIGVLALMFYYIDRRNHKNQESERSENYSGKISVKGSKNLIFLAITIGAVFVDPNVMSWVPYIDYHGDKLSFLRELIMLSVAVVAYLTANKEALAGNEFSFEPIREVGFLFIGIFATMMPALHLIGTFASSNPDLVDTSSLYWATGALSGVLDNAPTYLNFLAAAIGKTSGELTTLLAASGAENTLGDIGNKAAVGMFQDSFPVYLKAISIASVFFGAFTYIGNAPNFMVKSIAEQVGIQMPSFVSYIVRYSIPILLPVLALTYLVFFVLL